jgi:hypothetical protein
MAPVALNFYAGICGWTRGAGALAAQIQPKGMTAGFRCVVGDARDAL